MACGGTGGWILGQADPGLRWLEKSMSRTVSSFTGHFAGVCRPLEVLWIQSSVNISVET